MKYKNSEVCHGFIYGETMQGGHLSIKDGALYSYDSILAIKKDDIIIISNYTRKYSITSAKHHSALLSAIPPNYKIIYIYHINFFNPYDNLNNNAFDDKLKEYFSYLKKQKRAYKVDYSYMLNKTINELKIIVNFGKIDKRSKNYKLYLSILNGTNMDKLLQDSIKAEKLEKLKIVNNRYKSNLKRLQNFTGRDLKNYTKKEINECNFLKIVDDKIKTSGGVTVGLQDAKNLYNIMLSGKNIIGLQIGYYTVLKNNDNFVQIGCHKILKKELKAVLL